MLKIEVDIKNGEIRAKANGLEPLIYVEMGIAVKKFYQILCNHNPKERAKQLIRSLAESSLMGDEELERELAKRTAEEPELIKTAEMLRDSWFRTEGEENE